MSDRPSIHVELLLLCGKVRDEVLSPADAARLDVLLQGSDDAKALFVQYMTIASLLESRGVGEQSTEEDREASATINQDVLAELLQLERDADAELVHQVGHLRGPSATRLHIGGALRWAVERPAVWGAIAAMLTVALILITLFNYSTPKPASVALDPTEPTQRATEHVATLTASHNARWAQGAFAPGSPLQANQRLTLTAGYAEITTNAGAVAILEAPATIKLTTNNNAIRLESGKLVGLCHTSSSKGFVVRTDHADITDLGTEFGVEVTDRQLTTTVFTGEVELSTPDGRKRSLVANQTARFKRDGRTPELVVEEQLATGFDTLRSQAIQNSLKLPITGDGLAIGEADPNWQIVAVNGQSLEQPLVLRRVDEYTREELQVPDSRARWIARDISKDPSVGLQGSIPYTLRATLTIPAAIDPANAQLTLRYLVDDAIVAIRLNGRSLPINKLVHLKQRRIVTQQIEGPLVAGPNTIELEIANYQKDSFKNFVGLIADWQLFEQPPSP